MNTGQLAAAVAESTGLGKNQAKDAVNAFIHIVQREIRKGGKVSLAGFGSFSRTDRKARPGRNPKTGESVRIPKKRVPKFSAGRSFKEVVNGARKLERPSYLSEAISRQEVLKLCKAHGISTAPKTAKKKKVIKSNVVPITKKTTKKAALKKAKAVGKKVKTKVVAKKAVRRAPTRAAAKRRKKKT